jgi:hypothetical protein
MDMEWLCKQCKKVSLDSMETEIENNPLRRAELLTEQSNLEKSQRVKTEPEVQALLDFL